ncbi:hypothetical protein [Maribellus sediminis]|uniref:hypothetical protein n=1 Tax=Maribellus sediminis TaxID=2696285 RepID=UPI00143041C2|nr:hypothetical protein [Maribellus sediminis]
MVRKQAYFRWVKHLTLVLLALFSLASCSVKEPVFRAIGVDYLKPLNKTKVSQNFEHNCNTSPDDYLQSGTVQHPDNKLLAATNMVNDVAEPAVSGFEPVFSGELVSSKNIPFYILYKRLKFDMV